MSLSTFSYFRYVCSIFISTNDDDNDDDNNNSEDKNFGYFYEVHMTTMTVISGQMEYEMK